MASLSGKHDEGTLAFNIRFHLAFSDRAKKNVTCLTLNGALIFCQLDKKWKCDFHRPKYEEVVGRNQRAFV